MSSTDHVAQVYPSFDLLECPYPFFAQLRTDAPVYKLPDRDEYVISRHEDIALALRRSDLFSAEIASPSLDYKGGKHILGTDPPEHTAKRKLASRPFTPKRLREIEPMIQRHIDRLIDGFVGRGEVDFVEDFAFLIPIYVITELMGLRQEGPEFELLQAWSRADRSNSAYFPEGGEFEQRKRQTENLIDDMLEYLAGVVRSRHEAPGPDIISELVELQVEADGELDLPNLTSITAELVAGGVTTTAHMMASAMMLLLQNPAQLAKVQSDFSLIPPMLEETLRVESPVQWRARIAATDVEIGGTRIPKGSRVLLLLAAGNRDEACFHAAEAFDFERPRRELKEHFGFGYGTHFCLGAPLGRLEGKLAFETFLSRTTNIRPVEAKNDFRPIEHLHFRAPTAVYLTFDRV
jgi:cytochrome P450